MAYPRLEAGLLALAVLAVVLALLLPAQPWYAPETRVPAVVVSALWACWRGITFDRARAHYRAWTQTPSWEVTADALDQYHP